MEHDSIKDTKTHFGQERSPVIARTTQSRALRYRFNSRFCAPWSIREQAGQRGVERRAMARCVRHQQSKFCAQRLEWHGDEATVVCHYSSEGDEERARRARGTEEGWSAGASPAPPRSPRGLFLYFACPSIDPLIFSYVYYIYISLWIVHMMKNYCEVTFTILLLPVSCLCPGTICTATNLLRLLFQKKLYCNATTLTYLQEN